MKDKRKRWKVTPLNNNNKSIIIIIINNNKMINNKKKLKALKSGPIFAASVVETF